MKIKFVSYHNNHPLYVACGQQLARSMTKVGVSDYHIEQVNNNSWDFHEACAYKPIFIRQCLERWQDYSRIVYVDSDSIFWQYPILFEQIPKNYDIGVHYRDNKELLGSTIYLANNLQVRGVVGRWGNIMETSSRWDQKELQDLLETETHIYRYMLPANYCQIFDLMAGQDGEPVIAQMQASRKSRGLNLSHNPVIT